MLIFESRTPDTVTDAYVREQRLPQADTCQDWKLVSSTTDSDSFLMIQVRRKLNTGDPQDHIIRNDRSIELPVHRIIAAWGDDEVHGYHGSKTARGAVRWFSQEGDEETIFHKIMDAEADGSFFVGTKDYPIKPQDTEYPKFCTSGADMRAAGVPLDDGATIIGFEPLVDNKEHVHHYIITAGYTENNDVNATACQDSDSVDMVYIWAPGEPPLTMPENVGFNLGGPETLGYRSFTIEIHYDNPELKEGAIDSSGVKFYYSREPREYDAGFLILGDSTVALEGMTLPQGLSDYDFHCSADCSALALGDEPVTVVREYLHMHQSGSSAYNEHVRDGEVIRTGKAEFFDFKQQGGHIVQQDPFEIKPGDSFNTRCFYNNDINNRRFGLSSSDEMCMAFLLYYPRKTIATDIPWFCGIGLDEYGLGACESTWKEDFLTDDSPMKRTFGTESSQCGADSKDTVDESSASAAFTSMAFAVLGALASTIFLI